MVSDIKERLVSAGVQPTRIRLALARIIFDGEHKHITAHEALAALQKRNLRPSLASVYNTLNHFHEMGLLGRVTIDGGSARFDTRLEPHHHIYNEDTGELTDISADSVTVKGRPRMPRGSKLKSVDVIFRIGSKG
ncbi:MAG: transcriptional repressor [Parvularculaceae bacterium]